MIGFVAMFEICHCARLELSVSKHGPGEMDLLDLIEHGLFSLVGWLDKWT